MERKEAIEKVRRWNLPKETREILEALAPELKESEDERIRKWLIDDIKRRSIGWTHSEFTGEQILARLEKQKEMPTDEEMKLLLRTEYEKGVADTIAKYEQKEQRPAAEEILAKAGLKPYKDGNQWCILAGDNIQEGICGFGDTIDEALYEFLKEVLIMANSPQLKEQKPAEPSDEELQRHQDELYDFKVFAARQAREHHISFVHDFEWNNFCAELLSYFNEKQKVAAAIPNELVECYRNLCERGNREVASLIDAINGFYGRESAPKFRVGDVMRTKQEAAEEMTDGMPVVVSIDDDYYICNNERIPIADQEEYEFPPMNTGQQPVMIQWTGKNLKEVIDFTGKSPKFGEWFKSWDEFEEYVHSHDDILKLFCEDGSHYEVPVGAWIVKTPGGYNIPSRFRFVQKPAERSEKHIADIFEKVGLAKIAREQGNDELTNALQDAMLELSRMESVEWSEEDEKMLAAISKALGCDTAEKILVNEGVTLVMAAGFLEFLRPSWKPSDVCYGIKGDPDPAGVWKPSEEQKEALEYVIRDYREDGCNVTANYLQEILDHLKNM